MKYVTMLGLTTTENFGSQLMHFFCLYAIAQKTGHRVVFLDQYTKLGRGLKFHLPFKPLPFELLNVDALTEDDRVYSNYPINLQIPVSSDVFFLDKNLNINFQGFFTSYRYWYSIREKIFNFVKFKSDIINIASNIILPLKSNGRQVISIHVRRSDYIEGGANTPSSTLPYFNPSVNYYTEAMALFQEEISTFIVFSDDIPWCKESFRERSNLVFSEGTSPEVDMCAMTLCDHNIIANSTFSFLGALLNRTSQKKVICPGKYLKNDHIINHMNHCWFPDDFIPLIIE